MIKCNWITLIFFAVIVMLLMTFTYEKEAAGDTKGTMGTFDNREPEPVEKLPGLWAITSFETDCTPNPKSKRLWIAGGFIGLIIAYVMGFFTSMWLINLLWQDKEDERLTKEENYHNEVARRIKEMGEGK